MIVISDTSPFLNLSAIGQLELLEMLYGKVFIPEAVFTEISLRSDQRGAVELQQLPWIETQSVANRTLVDSLLLELDRGEAEAIALAIEACG